MPTNSNHLHVSALEFFGQNLCRAGLNLALMVGDRLDLVLVGMLLNVGHLDGGTVGSHDDE